MTPLRTITTSSITHYFAHPGFQERPKKGSIYELITLEISIFTLISIFANMISYQNDCPLLE